MKKPGWLHKLEKRWQVSSIQALLILVVFACTGFTILFLKRPALSLFVDENERTWVFTLIYYLLILPVYNIILLIYGFIFGQFRFFWEFEKRMFRRIFRQ